MDKENSGAAVTNGNYVPQHLNIAAGKPVIKGESMGLSGRCTAVVVEQSASDWAERVEVLTKAEHEQYTEWAKVCFCNIYNCEEISWWGSDIISE